MRKNSICDCRRKSCQKNLICKGRSVFSNDKLIFKMLKDIAIRQIQEGEDELILQHIEDAIIFYK